MLSKLQNISMRLYTNYRLGLLTQKEYLNLLKPIDEEIDKLELQTLSYYLQGNLVSKISSSKHLH